MVTFSLRMRHLNLLYWKMETVGVSKIYKSKQKQKTPVLPLSLTLNIFSSVSLLTSSLSKGCFSFTTALHKASRSPNSMLDTPLETANILKRTLGKGTANWHSNLDDMWFKIKTQEVETITAHIKSVDGKIKFIWEDTKDSSMCTLRRMH